MPRSLPAFQVRAKMDCLFEMQCDCNVGQWLYVQVGSRIDSFPRPAETGLFSRDESSLSLLENRSARDAAEATRTKMSTSKILHPVEHPRDLLDSAASLSRFETARATVCCTVRSRSFLRNMASRSIISSLAFRLLSFGTGRKGSCCGAS